jgi:hypothetical protein
MWCKVGLREKIKKRVHLKFATREMKKRGGNEELQKGLFHSGSIFPTNFSIICGSWIGPKMALENTFTQWPLRCCQSPQTCTAFADIFLCLNSADQLKVEPTGLVTFTCPVPVGSIRLDTRSSHSR